ncbi:Transcription factor HY5 [Tetrabaena socialis]|uniref:Transcription factor HY5 n=1 Tax=Tetrabaena socialis TaxID=47790 RepID=A0A2J7ZMC7_9CHLO|nr:Transcription factor HY5 [Tetrabaena socialis]|eukprot:PNH01421.1 Transcription factor HY5 [Tetrabaena socialis]
MDVDAMDLAAILGEPSGSLPDDLDYLIDDELMQFLNDPEPAKACWQAPDSIPAPVVSSSSVQSSRDTSDGGCAASPPSTTCGSSPPPVAPAIAPAAAAYAAFQLQMQPGAPCQGLDPRLITTTAAQQLWTAVLAAAQAAAPCSAPAVPVDEAKARGQPAGTSRQGSADCSADSSGSDGDDDGDDMDSKARAGNKRKAPEVDWRQITDPSERRRQRRLAKNRVTAARSRERKKAAWSELEEKLKGVENENSQLRAMLQQFASENSSLKSQLLNITRAGVAGSGAAGASQARTGKARDPAKILPVIIAIMLLVLSLCPGDAPLLVLGSLLPVALAASQLGGEAAEAGSALDSIFNLLHMLRTLFAKSGRLLQRSVNRLLFERHRYLGRSGMRKLACVPCDVLLRDRGEGLGGEPGAYAGGAAVSAAVGASCAMAEASVPMACVVVKQEPVC